MQAASFNARNTLRRLLRAGSCAGPWALCLSLIALAGCGGRDDAPQVVVYTALDAIYSEPILKDFESRTGIHALPVYDAEAAKTTGLVSRLQAESARPRCDVFWNNEIIQTIRLKQAGILAPYRSPYAVTIPDRYKDAGAYWTGFAGRARVLVWNTNMVPAGAPPTDIMQLTDPKWRGMLAIAYPLFGTTATHAAALDALWGTDRTQAFFKALKANGVVVLDGNSVVCRSVAQGETAMGLTDTDDASLVKAGGKPIDFALLDHDGQGALLVPNTVALVAGAPHPEAARKLIDYLLSPSVEATLAASPSVQIPLHPGVPMPPAVEKLAASRFLTIDYALAAERMPASADFLKSLFDQP